ncbi:hypothetical protein CKM354_000784400 [Cercospora kikuchii]|uniref:Uncharacterized protein n=1 Tax=Cercospora kikuchii TaxID=84275 RepID=A0A9P3CUN7_9PEZI|nr:uncharacterized protein CKM354_000784400 [Cercospora kikuchii]GIZ44653.1 hypothetical protein CKM354_000784400 [Cercospora kikuchii]
MSLRFDGIAGLPYEEQLQQVRQFYGEQMVYQCCRQLFESNKGKTWRPKAIRGLITRNGILRDPRLSRLGVEDVLRIVAKLLRQAAFPGHGMKERSNGRRNRSTRRRAAIVPAGRLPASDSFFLQYSDQHELLAGLQSSLEECCYEFVQREGQDFFPDFRQDCASALRSSKWLSTIRKHPIVLTSDEGHELHGVMTDLRKLERTVISRTPVRASRLLAFCSSATRLAHVLDPDHEQSKTQKLCDSAQTALERVIAQREESRRAVQDGLSYMEALQAELSQEATALIEEFSVMCLSPPRLDALIVSDRQPTPICPDPMTPTDWIVHECTP